MFERIKTYSDKIQMTKTYLIYCLAFSFPIHQKISTLLLIITGILSILDFKKSDVRTFFKIAFPILLLYILYTISYARDGLAFNSSWFERKASLLIFPIIFFNTELCVKKRVLKYFVYGCVVSYSICLIAAIITSFDGSGFNFIKDIPNINIGFLEAIDYNANKLLGSSFMFTGFQRAYFAMYFSFALCILWLGFEEEKKTFKSIISIILSIGILQTWSLAGMLSMFIVGLYLTLILIRKKYLKIVFLIGGTLLFIGVINFNNRANFMYKTIMSGNMKIDGPTASTIRLRPWLASIHEMKKKPVFGYGIKNAQHALNSFYRAKKEEYPQFKLPLEKKLNAHNQYFQFVLESGVIGLLIFLLVLGSFVYSTKYYTVELRNIAFVFLILIVFNSSFESIMNRYIGISFFAFFCSLFLFHKKRREHIKVSK